MMRAYAETDRLPARFVLSYFGEPFEPPCGNCDNCLAGTVRARRARGRAVRGRRARRPRRLGRRASSSATRTTRVVVLFDDVGYKTLALAVVVERALLRAA